MFDLPLALKLMVSSIYPGQAGAWLQAADGWGLMQGKQLITKCCISHCLGMISAEAPS